MLGDAVVRRGDGDAAGASDDGRPGDDGMARGRGGDAGREAPGDLGPDGRDGIPERTRPDAERMIWATVRR